MPSRVLPSVCVHGQSAAADSLILWQLCRAAFISHFQLSWPSPGLSSPGCECENTANCQPGCIVQLTNGHTSGLETGSATSFLHLLLEALLLWRLGSHMILAARGIQPNWLSCIQDHVCALCGPGTQECLCPDLCQKHSFSWKWPSSPRHTWACF